MSEKIFFDDGYDYQPAREFFLTATYINLAFNLLIMLFIALTSAGACPRCLPKLHLGLKDPIILSLIGVSVLATLCDTVAVLCQHAVRQCGWAFRAGGIFYVMSYYFGNLFLLAKLRAVETSLNALWYQQFLRIVSILTYFGMPVFAIILGCTTWGIPVHGANDSYICVDHLPWWISAPFAVLQCFAGIAYLILFTMPLITTEKQVTASFTSDGRLHAVVVRNLISCAVSVFTTFFAMTAITVGHFHQATDQHTAGWTISCALIDLTVNMAALLFAINPAWRYTNDRGGSAGAGAGGTGSTAGAGAGSAGVGGAGGSKGLPLTHVYTPTNTDVNDCDDPISSAVLNSTNHARGGSSGGSAGGSNGSRGNSIRSASSRHQNVSALVVYASKNQPVQDNGNNNTNTPLSSSTASHTAASENAGNSHQIFVISDHQSGDS